MRRPLRRQSFLVLAVLGLTLAGALSQAAASVADQSREADRTEAVSLFWEGGEGRKVTVVVQSGYCLGEAKPQLQVEENEAPRTEKFPRGAVILKALLMRPPSSARSTDPASGEPVPICNDVGLRLKKLVTLARPLDGRPVLERVGPHLRKAVHLP